ncbi:hypothetical protein PV325_007036 [Microctonus aethiopoides]|uniref:Uncharacterized protein n=1 Tax=Microctonus aethiopoides TaxID=144406 RepID=A0AA39KLT9_9HYME|nr:hypothetical protein PV325_007036 [Microctonus aethiopoides]KAK0091994.1 hypothetical protein PV326_002401 [Microctonus aethiopoides]KAK0166268.1 hypothetical protein PV328_004704 [Microctonus aethiopoides]
MRLATLIADSSTVGPSSEYSDSLDTTIIPINIPCGQDYDSLSNDGDRPSDDCNCGEIKNRSMRNVSIDPSPRYFGEHEDITKIKSTREYLGNKSISDKLFGESSNIDCNVKLIGQSGRNRRIKDLGLSENSCFNQMPREIMRGNEVRRVASSDSIPFGTVRRDNSIKNFRVLSQDCVRHTKNHEIKQLRYIQSAKGTWSYNL